jgi:UDP-hydrolysing UDP-N-acetyl-D-glucosamine 2-epimerase
VRTVAVVTVGRSDYSILRPVLHRIQADHRLKLALIVAGNHFEPEYGGTVSEIEADGFPIAARVPYAPSSDDGQSVAAAIGVGVEALASVFAEIHPSIVLVVGDRFELLAVAAAAVPMGIPLGHVHGGELTEGAFDDSIRHALTKLSHVHFASNDSHARRILQLGEEPWRVVVTGAPALDEAMQDDSLSETQLAQRLGLGFQPAPLLVSYHAATLDATPTDDRVLELLGALDEVALPVVFTYPGPDPGAASIRRRIEEYVSVHDDAVAVASLGGRAYYSLMRRAAAMIGNSSSGIVEAPSFRLPVVNVGSRQDGRLRARNVIDTPVDREAIAAAIRHAVSTEFRNGLADLVNPYGDGHASERIVETLATVDLGPALLTKRFQDMND